MHLSQSITNNIREQDAMLISDPLPFVKDFIEALNDAIQSFHPGKQFSAIQRYWLSFIITGILVTNSVCWAKFQRCSLGKYSISALSWMFRKSSIKWEILLAMSVFTVLKKYGITDGNIGIDDSDKKRSKSTKRIHQVHKMKDKTTGGYMMGQSVVFLVLITSKITIPVGFAFHMPDPALKEWKKENERLKKKGVPKKLRPAKPERNENFPTIQQIALKLLTQFHENHPDVRIRCIFADALYGTKEFVDGVHAVYPGAQVISQIRSNQNVKFRGKYISVEDFFKRFPGTEQIITVRGEKEIRVIISSARIAVQAHSTKRFVIAIKYEGEVDFRFIIASDLSWRTIDIIETYTLRWLVEVFFEDWKGYEGWGQLTKQTGEEGSSRGLILSLLVDHCLFVHPDQKAQIENKLPAFTVGSLITKVRVEVLLDFIKEIVYSENAVEKFKEVSDLLSKEIMRPSLSKKHMVNRMFGRLEPTPSLKYRKAA